MQVNSFCHVPTRWGGHQRSRSVDNATTRDFAPGRRRLVPIGRLGQGSPPATEGGQPKGGDPQAAQARAMGTSARWASSIASAQTAQRP